MLEKAIKIAVNAHSGQTDKAGQPYILHLIRVMINVNAEKEKICAILHDLVEDTDYTLDDLKSEGFSEEIIATLSCLTKRENENYFDFINRVKENKIAINVKLADLKDNMNLTRLQSLTEKDFIRLEKYVKAYNILSEKNKPPK